MKEFRCVYYLHGEKGECLVYADSYEGARKELVKALHIPYLSAVEYCNVRLEEEVMKGE